MNSSAKNKWRTTNEIRLINNFPFRHKQRIFITRNSERRKNTVYDEKINLSIFTRPCMEAREFPLDCKGISGMS